MANVVCAACRVVGGVGPLVMTSLRAVLVVCCDAGPRRSALARALRYTHDVVCSLCTTGGMLHGLAGVRCLTLRCGPVPRA